MSDEILSEILAVASSVFKRPVTANDNFFDLGGESLQAMQLCTQLEELLGMELDIGDIFEAADMAAYAMTVAGSRSRFGSSRPR